MSPHSNRSKNKALPGREPRPEELLKYRQAAGLTREQAADLVYTSPRNWEAWEQEKDGRRMPASAFELFMLKTGQYRRLDKDGPKANQVELDNGAVVSLWPEHPMRSPRD